MAGVDHFETSLTESSCSQDEENEDTDNDHALEESALLSKIERKPNVQFGINNRNLDLINSGHQP